MSQLEPGQKAPDFTLLDANGESVKLSGFRGKKVLLYFYPKALTPGCTTQACEVSSARVELAARDIVPLGVSPDKPALLKRFDEQKALGFTLLSDPDHAVAEQYDVWGEKKLYGKPYMGLIRSAFLIDESGVIARAWYKVSPKETVPNALKATASRTPRQPQKTTAAS